MVAETYPESVVLERPSYWESDCEGMDDWAEKFCSSIRMAPPVPKDVILGYSMGGRLAMQALVTDPVLWSGAILISSDPGLDNQAERNEVGRRDMEWSQRLRLLPLSDVVKQWDKLPIFGSPRNPAPRDLDLLDASLVAEKMTCFSKARQADLRGDLAETNVDILALTGESDSKYCQIWESVSDLSSNVQHKVISASGHRVPWDSPEDFQRLVIGYIGRM